MPWVRLAVVAVLACAACNSPAASEPAPPALAVASAKPAASPKAHSRAPGWEAVTQKPQRLFGTALLERGVITKLATDKGRLVAEIEGRTPALLVVATKTDPLLPRSRAAHFRIAEKLAPGLVAPAAFRSLKIAELSTAADKATLARLERDARVLGNGRIEAVVSLSPAPSLERVDIANLKENQPAWRWEGKLVVRAPVPEADRTTLSSYQSLVAVDWVVGNLKRRYVQFHEKSGRITVADESEAFSATPDDNAVHDGLARFARHMTYSKSLSEHLRSLTRESVEGALRAGDPASLLVTPKQVDEVVENARALERVIQTRVKQRGQDALGLP